MQQKRNLLAYLLPRLRDILFFGALFSVTLNGQQLFNLDGDLGRHITVGNYMLETASIPTEDVFSHTMRGEHVTPHEWLAQLALALAHRAMGLSGNVFLSALLIASTFLIVYHELLARGNFRLTAMLVTLVAVAASAVHWLARPHLFTFLFIALWTFGLEKIYKNTDEPFWKLPLLMLLWANTHGAFIAGFVVFGAYAAEWAWEFLRQRASIVAGKKLALVGSLSFLLTFLNPSGWHLWQTSVGYVGSKYLVDRTIEYMSPDFHLAPFFPFLFMLAFALLNLASGYKLQLRDALLLAGWAAMGLYSARNIPLFAIVTAPALAALVQTSARNIPALANLDIRLKKTEAQLRGIVWLLLSAVAMLFAAQNHLLSNNQYHPEKFPAQAVNWLEENPQTGNVFNHFEWGGYLLYRMYPRQTVFIDGQTDFYGEALTREYERVVTVSAGWELVLEKYNIAWMILPQGAPLSNHLTGGEKWKVIYQDHTAVIFRRVE